MTANPGWYPDPDGKGGQRYFDGSSWTDARIAPKKPFAWASVPIAGWIGLALLGIVIVVVFAVVASGGSRDSASYQYGREQVSPLAITFMKQGLQGGPNELCRQAADAVLWVKNDFVAEDVVAGCVDRLSN